MGLTELLTLDGLDAWLATLPPDEPRFTRATTNCPIAYYLAHQLPDLLPFEVYPAKVWDPCGAWEVRWGHPTTAAPLPPLLARLAQLHDGLSEDENGVLREVTPAEVRGLAALLRREEEK